MFVYYFVYACLYYFVYAFAKINLVLTIEYHDILCNVAVVKHHDIQSEGLSRRIILKMVREASGGTLTPSQCANVWDKTIFPLGKRMGLLTGYVKPQDGTSKRTAAGAPELQKQWYDVVTKLFAKVRQDAKKILKCDKLVDLMMPWLVCNLDEECLHAMGKNCKVVGAKGKKKHDNQNASSRSVLIACHSVCDNHPEGENACYPPGDILNLRFGALAAIVPSLLCVQGLCDDYPLWVSCKCIRSFVFFAFWQSEKPSLF